MPNHGKRGNSRGGDRGRGGRGGRGRGRGSQRGGGRGRNRELIPSAIGYVYRPRSNVDDEDDFRIYGQFSSDEADSGAESSPKQHSKKKSPHSSKKNRLGFVKESRSSFGSNYDDHYDDSMDRAGLGLSSSPAAANDSNTEDRFAKGKSKYLKTVLFTKSSSSLDLNKANEKVVMQKAVVEEAATKITDQQAVVEPFSHLIMDDFISKKLDEKVAKMDLLKLLKANGDQTNSFSNEESPVQEIDYVDIEYNEKVQLIKEKTLNDAECKSIKLGVAKENETIKNTLKQGEEDKEDASSTEESDDEDNAKDEKEEKEEEDELFYEGSDTDDDELIDEDIRIMEDYLENIELEDGEDLNDLLAWSLMQEGNLEIELDSSGDDEKENHYDYASLDKKPLEKTLSDFEEEEKAILKEKKKSKLVDESTRKKVSHRTQVDDTIVDPEIFGQTLRAALADVPPGLRPGMRRWYEKQQRKEDRKKKKEEAKAHRKENKKNGKSKGKEQDEEDFANQIAKIDDRLRDFIQDDSITSFQFAPMITNVRRQLHVLAAAYNLKSKSTGGGGSRSTIVTKTTTTYIPNDRRFISRYLTDIQTNMDEQNRIIGKNRSKGVPLKGKKKIINQRNKNNNNSAPKDKRGDGQFPTGLSHGTVVAHDAAPIGESNVGHRMLAAMGWKQGEALGSKSEGIIAPIEAIIRKKGRGLGS